MRSCSFQEGLRPEQSAADSSSNSVDQPPEQQRCPGPAASCVRLLNAHCNMLTMHVMQCVTQIWSALGSLLSSFHDTLATFPAAWTLSLQDMEGSSRVPPMRRIGASNSCRCHAGSPGRMASGTESAGQARVRAAVADSGCQSGQRQRWRVAKHSLEQPSPAPPRSIVIQNWLS